MDAETTRHRMQPGATDTAMIRVFGHIGVDGADGPINIGGPRQRRLLALLAVRVGTVVDIGWLAEYLWTDEDRPDATEPAIRTYVSRLRQALPSELGDWVETVPSGYRLAAPPDQVEHRRFAALRASATTARTDEDPLTAVTLLDEALELWRGEPFRELEDLDWALSEIAQLQLDRLEMREERWEAALALGRHTQITGELAAFTAEHRQRDRAAQQYAIALHRSGRTAEALRSIADFRRRLAEESGLDLSHGMDELERAIFADDPSLRVEQLGRPLRGYRLLEEAGSGAFSVVWRGEQPSVRREVAIKQIRAELASQPEFIRRFEAEAHLVARLEHPHIVPLIDFWRDPDSAYLVMRWLPGGTLERRLDDGPLTPAETLALARQIGGALSTAHARGIVHRDVKTANILFDDQQHAFLSDFGIALEATASAGPEAALSPGSPLYASPEQLRREPLRPTADVFSLGIVLFECLTGSLPFPPHASPDDLIDQRLTTDVPALGEHLDVPQAIADAVATATAHDAADRYSTIAEFIDALDVASTGSVDTRPTSVPDGAANPYVGLRAFEDGDTDRFFGRSRLVRQIIDRLGGTGEASRCCVVVGPSGSGKSSVVRAGVIPAVRAGAIDGSDDWFVTTMVPGGHPFEALETALLRVAVNAPSTLLAQLRDERRGILRGIRRCLRSDDDQLVSLIDHFEELFASPDADAFLDALTLAIDDPTSPLRVVATLRADYYDRPLGHPRFAPMLAVGAVDVVPLAADELELAVVEPAARLGVEFEPGLVARLTSEAIALSAPLPLLQYALSELFDRRNPTSATLTNAAYDELGGLSGALAARSETLYESADDEQRAAIRRVFGRLTDQAAASNDVRRRLPLGDLVDDAAARWVVDEFAAARLVTLDRDPATREPTIEVAHEALFREWPRLVRWLDDDRDLLRRSAAISRAASDWDGAGRTDADLYRGERLADAVELDADQRRWLRPVDNDFIAASQRASDDRGREERRRLRRLRRLVAGVAVALVVALVAGGIAVTQQQRADDEADAALAAAADAEAQAQEAEAQTAAADAARADADVATLVSRSAAQSFDDPQIALLLSLEAHRRSPTTDTERAVLNALTSGRVAQRVATYPRLLATGGACATSLLTSDGLMEYSVIDGALLSQDLTTGEIVDHGVAPVRCGGWLGDPEQDLRWVGDATGSVYRHATLDGTGEVRREVPMGTDLLGRNFGDNRLISISGTPASADFRILDATDGEPIGDVVSDVRIEGFPIAVMSADVAVVTAATDGDGGPPGGLAVVLDAHTGRETLRIDLPRHPQAAAIDETTGELIVAMSGGAVRTLDLATGEEIAEVTSSTTGSFDAVGVRPDGLLIVSSAGQVDLMDRRTGAVGSPLRTRGAQGGRIRPDGTMLVVQATRYDIYDFDSSGLVQQSWPYEPEALVNIESGIAGIVDPDGTVSLVDVETGERSELELIEPSGRPATTDAVLADAGGLLTFTFDGEISRWTDGQRAESITGTEQSDAVSVGGQGFGDRDAAGAAYIQRADLSQQVALVTTRPGELAVGLRVEVEGDLGSARPTPDGGLHIMSEIGTLRTYDSSGALVSTIETGRRGLFAAASDHTVGGSGRLAFGSRNDLIVVDPATEEVVEFPDAGEIAAAGFARDGELLVTAAADGSVRLWDVERAVSLGVLWQGSGTRAQNTPWYDAESDTVWVASSGQVIQLPIDPGQWVDRACELAGRDFTADEWERFVPGDGPVVSACPSVDE
ncbi:MAG: protein kinase [Ilumatobacter sp.]